MTATTQVTPTLGEFVELAKQGNVIPVFAEFIADGETPVSAFKKLDRGGYSFLFESTEKNDVSGRFSFIGVDPRVVMQSHGREVRIIEREKEHRLQICRGPIDEVRKMMSRYQFVSRPELPRFGGGAVGFIGYEAIHFFEPKVPLRNAGRTWTARSALDDSKRHPDFRSSAAQPENRTECIPRGWRD